MNWNSNDTKYILKRFIIYVLIAIAMFIIGTWKAHALVEGTEIGARTITFTSSQNGAVVFDRPLYVNYGYGTIITSMSVNCGPNVNCANTSIKSVTITRSNDYKHFACDIGNNISYQDSSMLNTTYTIKCPVDFTNNTGLYAIDIVITSLGSGQRYVNMSGFLTFVSQDSSEISNAINDNTQAVQETNNTIKDSNVTTSDADDFTNNQEFSDSTGLESVIQLPLNMVNALTNTCQPIQITIPFIDYTGQIPCMSTIYQSKFNALYLIVKVIINGFFVYRILLKVYELVHNAKQPDQDKLEVIEL